MHEYTPGMVKLFYRICLTRKQENFLADATANRIAQATDESWRAIQKDIHKSIDKLNDHVKQNHPREDARKDDEALGQFFGSITTDQKGKIHQMRRSDITKGKADADS